MKQTVIITGSSSGIGRATALFFNERGWQVVATMRDPARGADLQAAGIDVERLDVLDRGSIEQAIGGALARHGRIDAVVNNAGYSLTGAFEAASREAVEREFGTNVFGLMEVTRCILPLFKKQKGGTIINIASIAGRVAFPMMSFYHATKWAVEGFSESLWYELRLQNIKVKIVEPGIIKTDFYDRSMAIPDHSAFPEYQALLERFLASSTGMAARGSSPRVIARVVFRAATDGRWRLRYASGRFARTVLFMRRVLPGAVFRGLLRAGMP
jgi:NAD(P)-dependent dehydrogenase (short-subunit alcohol dehydrogenase family)